MGLKLRKRINNSKLLEHFYMGVNGTELTVGLLAGSMPGGINTNGQYNPISAENILAEGMNKIKYGGSLTKTPSATINATSNNSKLIGAGIMQAGQGALLILGMNAAANAAVKDESELQAEAGTSDIQGSGYSYVRLNNIDAVSAKEDLSNSNTSTTIGMIGAGASAGAAFGPIGAGIGAAVGGIAGFLGGRHRRNKLRKALYNALQQVVRNNNFASSSALSNYLANQYGLEHENTQDDALYTAKYGKDLRQPMKKK